MSNKKKTTIFLDCDDLIFYSSEAVIRILNKKYKLNKTIKNLADWRYESIIPEISQTEILSIYDSEEFWNEVELNQDFLRIFRRFKKAFNWVVLSYEKTSGVKFRERFLKKWLGASGVELIIVDEKKFEENLDFEEFRETKNRKGMLGSIQISDNMKRIERNNASIKVLFNYGKELSWNKPNSNEDNLYVVQNWEEIGDILDFYLKAPFMINLCYDEEQET